VNYYLVVTVSRNIRYIKVDGVRDSYPTLFALARTCSTLSEVSLEALWSDLESETRYERLIAPEWPSTINPAMMVSTKARNLKQ
jgi:hypothetical protein